MRTKRGLTSDMMRKTMTMSEIFALRLKAYSKDMSPKEIAAAAEAGGYKDEFDAFKNVKYYTQDRKAACRVHFGHDMPCMKYFDYVPLLADCEVSRLCIDPEVGMLGERMRILRELMAQVAQAAWGRKLYTSANADLAKVYTRWLGFSPAPEADVAEIPPGDEDVFLLVLDLGDKKTQERTKARLGW